MIPGDGGMVSFFFKYQIRTTQSYIFYMNETSLKEDKTKAKSKPLLAKMQGGQGDEKWNIQNISPGDVVDIRV